MLRFRFQDADQPPEDWHYMLLCHRNLRSVSDKPHDHPQVADMDAAVTFGDFGKHTWELTKAQTLKNRNLWVSRT